MKGFQSFKVRGSASPRGRRFSGREDAAEAGPYSSHGIPINVKGPGPAYEIHSMRTNDLFVSARDRGTPLAHQDAERLRLEVSYTEAILWL